MSLTLQALLVVGGGCTFALLLHVLVRRMVPLKVLEEHRPVAGVLLSVVGGVNGILLAFVMVTVWQNLDDVREGVVAEANAVANIARLAQGMPAPTGPELHDAAVAYLDAVVRDEWPRLANGQTSPEAERHAFHMMQLLVSLNPQEAGVRNLHAAAIYQMDQFGTQRRLRIIASRYQLPHLVWVVLCVGAVATIGFVSLFGMRYPRSELIMTGVVALVLFSVILTILALDHPFRGGVSLATEEMEEVLEMLRTR